MGKTNGPTAWLVMSDITSKPYIDELRQAYAFSTEEAAEELAEKVGRAHTRRLESGMDMPAMSECYAAGASTLIERHAGESSRHTLDESGLVRRYYNCDLNADAARYISTRRMEYIRNMHRCRFLVPVRIGNHPRMSVVYATAVFSDAHFRYLAFTDLEEYGKWAAANGGWAPLEVRVDSLYRIGRKHGFLLDPCGSRLLISKGMLKQILVGEEGQDD